MWPHLGYQRQGNFWFVLVAVIFWQYKQSARAIPNSMALKKLVLLILITA